MIAFRFFSKPNHPVSDGDTGKLLFRFDENGKYVTLDKVLSKRMMKCFKHEEIELVEKVKEEVEEKNEVEIKEYKCKKCDFTTDNKGELLAHYRSEHPKE